MVLSLTDPAGSNFIKDFPAQNAINCDAIDLYAGPCLITQPLLSWAPSFTADTANPVLGTGGYIKSYYYRIFDNVWTWGEFRFGSSGNTFGTGGYSVSLPFNVDTIAGNVVNGTFNGDNTIIGHGAMWDDSANNGQPLVAFLKTFNTIGFGVRLNSGLVRDVGPTSPVTFANLDGITWFAKFKRIP